MSAFLPNAELPRAGVEAQEPAEGGAIFVEDDQSRLGLIVEELDRLADRRRRCGRDRSRCPRTVRRGASAGASAGSWSRSIAPRNTPSSASRTVRTLGFSKAPRTSATSASPGCVLGRAIITSPTVISVASSLAIRPVRCHASRNSTALPSLAHGGRSWDRAGGRAILADGLAEGVARLARLDAAAARHRDRRAVGRRPGGRGVGARAGVAGARPRGRGGGRRAGGPRATRGTRGRAGRDRRSRRRSHTSPRPTCRCCTRHSSRASSAPSTIGVDVALPEVDGYVQPLSAAYRVALGESRPGADRGRPDASRVPVRTVAGAPSGRG